MEKVKKILRMQQTQNKLLSRRNGKAQPANLKNGGKNKVTWSLLLLTFHLNTMLNLSTNLNPREV